MGTLGLTKAEPHSGVGKLILLASPLLDVIQWQFHVFENEDQLFLYEDSLQFIIQMVHHLITGTWHNFVQSVSLLGPYSISGSLALVIVFFTGLQQVMIRSILRKCVFWEIVLSRGTSLQSNRIFRFHPSHPVSMSLSWSTNSYRCLTQVDNTFSGSFNVCAPWTLNNCSPSSLFKASTNVVWVCLYIFVVRHIIIPCFSSILGTSALNSLPLLHWNTLG